MHEGEIEEPRQFALKGFLVFLGVQLDDHGLSGYLVRVNKNTYWLEKGCALGKATVAEYGRRTHPYVLY